MFNKILGCGAVAATLAISSVTAQAQNLLTDPNFGGPFTANPITPTSGGLNNGWAIYGQAASSDMSSSPDYPYNGATSALLTQNTTWNGAGGYQIITTPLVAGATYTFSLWALSDNGVSSYSTPLALDLNFLGPWDPTLNGGAGGYPSLAAGGANGIVLSANDNQFANQPGQNVWTEFSVSMSAANVTGIAGIVIQPQTINGGTPPAGQTAQNIYFDGASLTDVVPEPTTLALAGLGGISLLSLIRRRKS